MNYYSIQTFDYAHEAHLVKSKLESEGIPCFIFDEQINAIDPMLAFATGGIKLKVAETDLQRANDLIHEIHNTELTNEHGEVITCPECNSSKIENGYTSANGLFSTLSTALALFFGLYPIQLNRKYGCKSCDAIFTTSS